MKQLLHDLSGITDENRIHKSVAEFFAPFGGVNGLKIFDLPEHDSRIVLVTMDDHRTATTIATRYGLTSFGERSLVLTVPNRHD